jgi:hypothetical protein
VEKFQRETKKKTSGACVMGGNISVQVYITKKKDESPNSSGPSGSGQYHVWAKDKGTLIPTAKLDKSSYEDACIFGTNSQGAFVIDAAKPSKMREAYVAKDDASLDNFQAVMEHFPNVFEDNFGRFWISEHDLFTKHTGHHFTYSKKAKYYAKLIRDVILHNRPTHESLQKLGVYLLPSPKPRYAQAFTTFQEGEEKVYMLVKAPQQPDLVGPNEKVTAGMDVNTASHGWGQSIYTMIHPSAKPVKGDELTGSDILDLASEALTNFYDGHDTGYYVNYPNADNNWNELIADKYRPSICDGGWTPSPPAKGMAFALAPKNTKDVPVCTFNPQNMQAAGPGSIYEKTDTKVPFEVTVTGLYYVPTMIWGLAVIFDGDQAPVWTDPEKLVRRVFLGSGCGISDVKDAKGRVASSAHMREHEKQQLDQTWPQTGCPKALPNYQYNTQQPFTPIVPNKKTVPWQPITPPVPAPKKKCGDMTDDKVAKAYSRDLTKFVPSHYQKWFTSGIPTDKTPTSQESAFISTHTLPEFKKFIGEAQQNKSLPFPHWVPFKLRGQISKIGTEWCDDRITYLWWTLGWPDSWTIHHVPHDDKGHTVHASPWLFLDELGLDLEALMAASAVGVGVAIAFRNQINPLFGFFVGSAVTLTGVMAYNDKANTMDKIKDAYEEFYYDLTKAKSQAKKDAKDTEKAATYILVGVLGLSATAFIMFGTYRELGSASSELLASELGIGLLLTGVAEVVVWFDQLFFDVRKKTWGLL